MNKIVPEMSFRTPRRSRFILSGILAVVLILAGINVSAQFQKRDINMPSPNAASLGLYGEVPVSLYTGIPNVDIPIYTIQEGKINVPVSLSYHASGVRVNQHPGWVGLNWNLNAGGSITRVVKGGNDESSFLGAGGTKAGYYYRDGVLGAGNWNSVPGVVSVLNQKLAPGGSVLFDTEPDEFSFNFLGYSGKFFRSHTGGWQVVSDSDIQIQNTAMLDVPSDMNKGAQNQQTFGGFILTTNDGMKYYFGGASSSIEYSTLFFEQKVDIWLADTWQLTKIEAPEGYAVTFSYAPKSDGKYIASFSNSFQSGDANIDFGANKNIYNYSTPNRFSGVLNRPVYLSKITFSKGYIDFTGSSTTELRYPNRVLEGFINFLGSSEASQYFSDVKYLDDAFVYFQEGGHFGWPSLLTEQIPYILNRMAWQKLDNISIKQTNGVLTNNIDLIYNNNSNQRLMLDTISVRNGDCKNQYVFSYYNKNSLPEYFDEYDQTDHWGFYNNNKLFKYQDIASNTGNYFTHKQPSTDINVLNAGSLEQIIYPTGGTTKFLFEPHTMYKFKTVNTDGSLGLINAGDQKVGGIRIKEITNDDGSKIMKKAYSYEWNAGSSGIGNGMHQYTLNSQRNYFNSSGSITGTYIRSSFMVNNTLPMSVNSLGSHIGYRQVKETNSDNSYTVYNYTNYESNDGSHMDDYILASDKFGSEGNIYDPQIDKSVERGKLLSQESYGSNGLVFKKTILYKKLSSNFVRAAVATSYTFDVGVATVISYIGIPYGYHAYRYQPNTEVTYYFDESSQARFTLDSVFYTYNEHGLPIEIRTKRNDKLTKIRNKYVSDYSSPSVTNQESVESIKAMKALGMNGVLIEQQTSNNETGTNLMVVDGFLNFHRRYAANAGYNNIQIEKTVQFENGLPTLELPLSDIDNGTFAYNSKYNLRIGYYGDNNSSYTLNGEPKQFTGLDGVLNTYEWNTGSKLGLLSSKKVADQQTSFDYDNPLIGVSKITDATGNYTTYNYDGFNRLETVKDYRGNLLQSYTYNLKNSKGCGTKPTIKPADEVDPVPDVDDEVPCRTADNPQSLVSGLNYNYYETAVSGNWCSTSSLAGQVVAKTGNVGNFVLTPANRAENFGFEFTGYLDVPTDGEYTFYLLSDDASSFYIGSQLVVSYEDCHGMDSEKSGKICLKAGKHLIKMLYSQGGGGSGLGLQWSGPGLSKQAVADSKLYRTQTSSPSGCPTFTEGQVIGNTSQNVVIHFVSGCAVAYWADGSRVNRDWIPYILNKTITDDNILKTCIKWDGDALNCGDGCGTFLPPTISKIAGTTACSNPNAIQNVTLRATGTGTMTWYRGSNQVATAVTDYVTSTAGTYTAKATNGSCVSAASVPFVVEQSSGCGSLAACDCGFSLLNAKQNSGQYTATFEFASCSVNAANWSILSGSTVVASGTLTVTTSIVPFTVPSNVSSGSYTLKVDVVNCSGSGTATFNYTKPGDSCAGTGTGLRGKYFNNFDLSGNPVLTRTDATINFVLANNSPAPGTVNADFSARWEGQVEAPASGIYTFKTNNDDGTRVWVNNVLVIDDWNAHGATVMTGTITLSACQKYDIKIEFFDSGAGGQAQLFWTYPNQSEQIVPQNRLYPATTDVCTAPSKPTINQPSSTTVCSASSQSVTLTANANVTWYKDGVQVGTVGSNSYTAASPGVYTAKAFSGSCSSEVSNSITITQSSGCGSLAACDCGFSLLNAKQNSGQYTATFEFASCSVNAANWSILSGSTVVASGTLTVTTSIVPFTVPSNVSSGSYTLKVDVVNCSGSGTATFNYTKPGESCAGTGTGLRGKYFNNFDLSGNPVLTRTDATINFVLANDSPAPGTVNADFSARWEGQVEAPASGIYTFKTNNDDGTRVWVNNVLVIDDWNAHGATVMTGTITLSACQKYDIKVEFFDASGGAQAQLFWSYPGQGEQIVPQSRLYPATIETCPQPLISKTAGTVCSSGGQSVTLSTTSSGTINWYNGTTQVGSGSSYTTTAAGTYTAKITNGSCVNIVSNSVLVEQTTGCGSLAACECGFTVGSAGQNSGLYTAWFQFNSCNVHQIKWTILSGSTEIASGTENVTSNTVPFTIPASVNSGSYTLRVDVVNCSGTATIALNYTKPGEGCVGTGSGLRGKYFNNNDLSGAPALARVDGTINFSQRETSPASGTVQVNFSARWEGQVEAPVSGTYTFKTNNDDGTRVWVNNVLLIDDWTAHAATVRTGSITLSACQKYDIKVEFYNYAVAWQAQLFWSYPGQGEQIVPQSRLYPLAIETCNPPTIRTSGTTVCSTTHQPVTLTAENCNGNVSWYNEFNLLVGSENNFVTETAGTYSAKCTVVGSCVSASSPSITVTANCPQNLSLTFSIWKAGVSGVRTKVRDLVGGEEIDKSVFGGGQANWFVASTGQVTNSSASDYYSHAEVHLTGPNGISGGWGPEYVGGGDGGPYGIFNRDNGITPVAGTYTMSGKVYNGSTELGTKSLSFTIVDNQVNSQNIIAIDATDNINDTYYFTSGGKVSKGVKNKFTNTGVSNYSAAAGKNISSIVEIARRLDGKYDVWYSDGTMSIGTYDALGNSSGPASYICPTGKSPSNIVGMAINSLGNVYTWYDDGTASIGTEYNLSSITAPYAYTLPSGKTPANIIGMSIERLNDNRIYTWYNDSTYSIGVSNRLADYSASLPVGN